MFFKNTCKIFAGASRPNFFFIKTRNFGGGYPQIMSTCCMTKVEEKENVKGKNVKVKVKVEVKTQRNVKISVHGTAAKAPI